MSIVSIRRRQVVAVLALASLSGCSALEPYQRTHVWTQTGSNEANLAAMVENPADLAHGRGVRGADGQEASAAVDRLRHDKVKALPANTGSGPGAGAAASTN